MRQVLLRFLLLLLVYTSVSEASPVTSGDENILPHRYPMWWRPSADVRSYWDTLIARLIWTHPAMRRYYKELAGWDSSKGDTARPSLSTILNEYEEHEPPTYRGDNRGENAVDEEHLIDIVEGAQEEPDTINNSAYMESSAESQHTENNGVIENQSNENPDENHESEITRDEGETADRERRSLASQNPLLSRMFLKRRDIKSRLGERRNTNREQRSTITAGELAEILNINVDDLVKLGLARSPEDELLLNLKLLEALQANVNVDLKGLNDLLGGLLGEGGLVGGLLRRGLRSPSDSHDSINRPFMGSALRERTVKINAVSGVDGFAQTLPATRTLNNVNLEGVDVNQLTDEMGSGTARLHVRSADTDCTSEQSMDDEGDASLVSAEILTGDSRLLDSRKKPSVSSHLATQLDAKNN